MCRIGAQDVFANIFRDLKLPRLKQLIGM